VCDFIYFIFNGVQVVHRRVTGFCAGEEAISSQSKQGAGFRGAGCKRRPARSFPGHPAAVKIWRKPCWAMDLAAGKMAAVPSL
jgi:hypothetical protein